MGSSPRLLREAPGLGFFSLLRPSEKGGLSGVPVHGSKGGSSVVRGVSLGKAALLLSGLSGNPARVLWELSSVLNETRRTCAPLELSRVLKKVWVTDGEVPGQC